MAVEVKTAIQNAMRFVADLQDDALMVRSIRVEEVELSDDGSEWLITLSFVPHDEFGDGVDQRVYKLFRVDAASGDVTSMKMRSMVS